MAEIAPELVLSTRQVVGFKWSSVTENDTCLPVRMEDKSDKTFMVTGTFGTGAVGLEGTLDLEESVYIPNRDVFGNVIAIGSDDRVAIAENDVYSRPSTPTGVSANVTCWLIAREGA